MACLPTCAHDVINVFEMREGSFKSSLLGLTLRQQDTYQYFEVSPVCTFKNSLLKWNDRRPLFSHMTMLCIMPEVESTMIWNNSA